MELSGCNKYLCACFSSINNTGVNFVFVDSYQMEFERERERERERELNENLMTV